MSGKIDIIGKAPEGVTGSFASQGPASYGLAAPIGGGGLVRGLPSSDVLLVTPRPGVETNDGVDRVFFLRVLATMIGLAFVSGVIALSGAVGSLAFFDG